MKIQYVFRLSDTSKLLYHIIIQLNSVYENFEFYMYTNCCA